MNLEGKRLLLGVSGSIAAYKSADIASQLGKLGADVHVVLTANASQFVGVPTFRALTRNSVLTDIFDEPDSKRIAHIELAQSADLVLIAPATANILAKMAHGIADDMLTTCLLATPKTTPLLIAPAMNTQMWLHPATVENVRILQARGVELVPPGSGLLACQDVGEGKLAEVSDIVSAVAASLGATQTLAGHHLLITAGATREPLDPVRFLTNRSSGKMGYALAYEAVRRGATVTLVSGHTNLTPPPKVNFMRVETAEQMLNACLEILPKVNGIIAAAAVADYRPLEIADHKLKKRDGEEEVTLRLTKNPDVIAEIGRRKRPEQRSIGFAAETQDLFVNANKKIVSKNLDIIVVNDVLKEGAGFDVDTNIVTLIGRDGRQSALPQMTKAEVSGHILDAYSDLA
ncbi:MAG: bifunctional phosphopantothenoylcysteine decarboxylase/phosphopantothenate--cysteine ligase CoaBC [Armatimonadetes bacterium]|nr:bifunctional phosphopantothenoylcysteine decarboxylase/phosphopantothenate--cysteine ligase CoaBC [Armatimonadota bacterium]